MDIMRNKERNIYGGFYYYQSQINHLILTSQQMTIESAYPAEPLRFIYTMNDCMNVDKLLNDYGKRFILYVGSEVDDDINRQFKNFKIITWDSMNFFAKYNIFSMPFRANMKVATKYYEDQKEIPPIKHFVSMTQIKPGRIWRTYIIDQLYKYNLVNYGTFPHRIDIKIMPGDFKSPFLNNFPNFLYGDKGREDFTLDYWDKKEIRLKSDEYYTEYLDYQLFCPNEYMICSFDAVVETLYEDFFVTEKTIRAIDAKKPFFVFTCPNFHTRLKVKYGFKLYDEIIDYGFDTILHTKDRFDAQINEMKKIVSKYTPQEIFDATKEKVDFNYARLNEIRHTDLTNIPDYFYNEYLQYDINKEANTDNLI